MVSADLSLGVPFFTGVAGLDLIKKLEREAGDVVSKDWEMRTHGMDWIAETS